MYFFYFLLGVIIFWGAHGYKIHEWNEEYCSYKQTKALLGIQAIFIILHHLAQKSCAPWNPEQYIVHGLDIFGPIGHLIVGVFLFCSGLGLYKSLKAKKNYLKNFVIKRIVPLVIAFYLSEFIYLIVRLLMHEKMSIKVVIWYLSGLHMANWNCWYLVAIIFFYFIFYFVFRFCKEERMAVFLIFFVCIVYTVLGVFIGHQDDWWMRGEWWYNSIILFPIGILFAKYEKGITAFSKKIYPVLLPIVIILTYVFSVLSDKAQLEWGYYGEYSDDPLTIPHRLGCCIVQWLHCIGYTASHILLLLKIRIGNRLLELFGKFTLEIYLMHGMFVEMFGFNFLDELPSAYYIESLPMYIFSVMFCSFVLTYIFHAIWKRLKALCLNHFL